MAQDPPIALEIHGASSIEDLAPALNDRLRTIALKLSDLSAPQKQSVATPSATVVQQKVVQVTAAATDTDAVTLNGFPLVF